MNEFNLNELDQKAISVLGVKGVVKALSRQSVFQRLPKYVSEYLIAKYVKPESWQSDIEKIKSKIKELLPDNDEKEIVKSKLLATGKVTLIDCISARVDLKKSGRFASIPAIGENQALISQDICDSNPGLLNGGLWGTVVVEFNPDMDPKHPNQITKFTPFQIGIPDVAEYCNMRGKFSTDEWCDLVLQSAGYNATAFPERRTRMLLFSRMIPLVERNVNMLELGPRQTGKTFLLRNLSPRVFTISGGKASPANLFVNLTTKQVGILGSRKVVVFDEIAHADFDNQGETISTLKDYMESGRFSRGSMDFASDASILYTGNIDVDGNQPHNKYRHLLEPLPEQLIDTAFQDRIHGFIPGWEMPKLNTASVSNGVGMLTDYFGEVLVKLRDESFIEKVKEIPLQAGLNNRDEKAIYKIGSGLMKIMYPDGKVTNEELLEIVSFACELRQRVHNQLVKIAPGEFKPKAIAPEGVTHTALDLVGRTLPSQDDAFKI